MYNSFDQPGTTNSSIFWHSARSSESLFLCRPLQETEHPYWGGRAAPLAPFRNNCNPSLTRHPKPSKPEEITDPLLKKPRISHSPKETASEQSRERMYKHGAPEDMAVTPGRSSVHLILCLLARNSRGQTIGKDLRPQQRCPHHPQGFKAGDRNQKWRKHQECVLNKCVLNVKNL